MRHHTDIAIDFLEGETAAEAGGADALDARAAGLLLVARRASADILRELERLVDQSPAVTWSGKGGAKELLNGLLDTIETEISA